MKRQQFKTLEIDGREYSVPTYFEVCDKCDGEGAITNPNIGSFSALEFYQEWSHEERESYFNGHYDVLCPKCQGMHVTAEVDYDSLEPDLRRMYLAEQADISEMYAEMASEQRMGA